MDIYVCSTQRHLMFSILRAMKTSNDSKIVMVLDQQGLDQNSFNTTYLPSYIDVQFIYRKELLNKIYSGCSGFIHKLGAVAMLSHSWLAKRTMNQLFEKTLLWKVSSADTLFVFNDRNRLSRLFRLAFDSYEVIEDGLSNYSGWKTSIIDKLKNPKRQKRYIGDDKRCKVIHLTSRENVDQSILSKVKLIDFIDHNHVVSVLFPFFNYHNESLEIQAIIATQPIAISSLSASGYDLKIYRKVIEELKARGVTAVVKVHPRENLERYQQAGFESVTFLDSKLPLELFLLSQQEKVDIYSIYSTAGSGFEDFCNIKTLVSHSESVNQEGVYNVWIDNEQLLDERIKQVCSLN